MADLVSPRMRLVGSSTLLGVELTSGGPDVIYSFTETWSLWPIDPHCSESLMIKGVDIPGRGRWTRPVGIKRKKGHIKEMRFLRGYTSIISCDVVSRMFL